jgi:outer membrane protein TolC
MAMQFVIPLFIVFTLSGCFAVGPDYEAPVIAAPAEWSPSLRSGVTAREPEAQTLAEWWSTLGDTDLSVLIERAVTGNLDLKTAQARIREARARRGIAQAGLFPSLSLGGSATVGHGSEDTGSGQRRELYRTGFDASWEADVFGGVRRSIEAAQGELEASAADYQDVLVSLVAEVGLNYVDARKFQTLLQVAEENLKTQAATLQLTEWRFAAGLVSSLDVEQARSNLENTRAQLPRLRISLEAAKNRIAILLRVFPGARRHSRQKTRLEPPLEVAGRAREMLGRRRTCGVPSASWPSDGPDRRRHRRSLSNSPCRNHRPQRLAANNLSTANRFWTTIASFRGLSSAAAPSGKTLNCRTPYEQALNQYEATILNALEEVDNFLIAFAEEKERRETLTEATRAARLAAELAQDQYASGLIDFQTVLDSQRSVLSFQEQLEQSKGQVTSYLISLYKALGGGWVPTVPITP